jgi:hypothetical protein
MKRDLFLLILSIQLITFSLQSCSKKKEYTTNMNKIEQQTMNRLHAKLENPDDLEDEQMNDYLLLMASGISQFTEQSFLMDIVRTKCMALSNLEVSYTSLVTEDSRFETLLNDYLVTVCEIEPKAENHNCLHHIDAAMIHTGVDYYPNLTVLNAATANWSYRPIVCVGEAIDADDRILALIPDNSGNLVDSALSETDVLNSTTPIIIVNNGTDAIDTSSDNLVYSNQPDEEAVQSTSNYIWYAYQIKAGHRYENGANNKSDLYFVITMHDQYNWLSGVGIGFPFGEHSDKIANVSPNDVNTSTVIYPSANYTSLFSQNLSATNTSNYRFAYITTFEKDWYASGKAVEWCRQNAPNFFHQKYHLCRMKYIDEWYINNTCTYNLTGLMPAINYLAAIGANKMYCEFKRTN